MQVPGGPDEDPSGCFTRGGWSVGYRDDQMGTRMARARHHHDPITLITGATMPRKIVATDYISLDGVVEDPVGMENSGLGNWVGPFGRGPVGDQFKHDELMAASAMIYGRKTYEGFAVVWPTIDDPAGFARRMNELPKYVASRTLGSVEWSNSSVIEGDLVDAARALKEQESGDILIYGSASIVHQLMPHGLIDEFRLMVYPTILGRGKRLFPDGLPSRLRLIENVQFGDGIVSLRYVPADPA